MFTAVQYQFLKRVYPQPPDYCDGSTYTGKSKLLTLMGPGFVDEIRGKAVIDFGCGEGGEAIEMALRGAARVTGVDIREDVLATARARAEAQSVQDVCSFGATADPADVIVSIDAFEHFADPAAILRTMFGLLKPRGKLLVCFGPTWFHPLGGHLFSVFPWAHLLFTEKALIQWRSTFKSDGATCFSECAGGLNRMTIARFERLAQESPLAIERLELVPIGKLQKLHCRWTREFTTGIVRCRLTKKDVASCVAPPSEIGT